MKMISRILLELNYLRTHFMVGLFEPKTFPQLHAWVGINRLIDLSYFVNMIECRLKYGVRWKNSY